MSGHHLILGELADVITGVMLEDTHDERYRQGIAALLVNEKGFVRDEINPRLQLTAKADEKCAIIKIDFGIILDNKMCMMIKYGPGSLVTRHRPALAASRMLVSYQIPVVVVTNGVEAEILDGSSGKIMARGLDAIPDKKLLEKLVAERTFSLIQPDRVAKESRIVYAYEVDGSCPCDDTICKIGEY